MTSRMSNWNFDVGRDDAVELRRVVVRVFGLDAVDGFSDADGLREDVTRDRDGLILVGGRIVAVPETLVCMSAPPSASAVTTSPVAAFTSGGPPRKMAPLPRTMTL